MCMRDSCYTIHRMTYEEVGDHELIICDPNKKNTNLLTKRCLYNKIVAKHLYEYGKQFWIKYQNNRKFLIMATNDGHEGTLEILKYLDDSLFNFLNDLFVDNLLKETTIFLLSDHGTAVPSPYYITNFFLLEKDLPMLYIICNDRKNVTYYEQYNNIKNNQQVLITAYDIYNTIGNLLFGDDYFLVPNKTITRDTPKSKFGKSLFNYINSKDRYPEIYVKMNQKMNINTCI